MIQEIKIVALTALGMLAATPAIIVGQNRDSSLPRISAPTAYGESVSTGIAAGASAHKALAPPSGVSEFSAADFSFNIAIGASWHSDPDRDGDDFEKDEALTITPTLRYQNFLGRHPYELYYAAGYENFNELSTEDSDYQTFGGAIKLDFSEKLVGDIYASKTEAEEQRGASSSRNSIALFPEDEYTKDNLGARLTFGRRDNIMQIYVGVEGDEIRFNNNLQDVRDRDQDTLDAGIFFNVGPKTTIFLHAMETDIDYQLVAPNQDSTETSLTLGLTWEANEAFSFSLEAGDLDKDFDDPTTSDFSGTTYTGKMVWSPTDENNLSLYTARTTEESAITSSSFYISELRGIEFSQKIGDRTTFSTHYATSEDDFTNGRIDDVTDYGISLGFSVAEWMNLGIGYGIAERDSNDNAFDFDDEVYSIFVNLQAF
jgi:hypothetical protein